MYLCKKCILYVGKNKNTKETITFIMEQKLLNNNTVVSRVKCLNTNRRN